MWYRVQSLKNEDDMVRSFIWLESNFEQIKQKLEDKNTLIL